MLILMYNSWESSKKSYLEGYKEDRIYAELVVKSVESLKLIVCPDLSESQK